MEENNMESQIRTRRRMRIVFGFIGDIILFLPRILLAVVVTMISILLVIWKATISTLLAIGMHVIELLWRLKGVVVILLLAVGVWCLFGPVYYGTPVYFGVIIPYPAHKIAEGVTDIPEKMYDWNANIKEIELPSTLTSIENGTFFECKSLEYVKISAGLTSIGDDAFRKCVSLKSIELPVGVTNIGEQAFSGCELLQSIEIPAGVTSIGRYAFYDCTSLSSIELPSSVTSIGDSAFADCTSLTSIELPSSVTSIGDRAFADCTSLTSIKLPASWESINGEELDLTSNGFKGMMKHDNHIYLFYSANGVDTWEEAKAYCEKLGGHLVTITTKEENDVITQLISAVPSNFYQIVAGATDSKEEGVWAWITGEKMDYINWNEKEADRDMKDKRDYLHIDRNGIWWSGQNLLSADYKYFLCEWDEN